VPGIRLTQHALARAAALGIPPLVVVDLVAQALRWSREDISGARQLDVQHEGHRLLVFLMPAGDHLQVSEQREVGNEPEY